jgi:hypothetical protein
MESAFRSAKQTFRQKKHIFDLGLGLHYDQNLKPNSISIWVRTEIEIPQKLLL